MLLQQRGEIKSTRKITHFSVLGENMSEEEKKPKKRMFKSRIECCVGFEFDRAVEFKRLMNWLIGLIDGSSIYSNGDVPLLLHPDSVEIKALDQHRIVLPHIVLHKADIDNFWFDAKANRRFSFPAKVTLPAKQLSYILEAIDKDSGIDMVFKLNYHTWSAIKNVEVRKPERCPQCNRPTIYNQLPIEKRGKRGDRYKCVCGWRGKVKRKIKKVKVYESSLLDNSIVEVEVRGKGKEHYELIPEFVEAEIPEPIPKIQFTAKVRVVRADFINRLKRVKKLTDRAVFEAKQGRLTITAKEDYIKSGKFELDGTVVVECKGKARAGYNVREMIEAIPPIGTVTTLQFADDMPILISATPENLISSIVECWQAPLLLED